MPHFKLFYRLMVRPLFHEPVRLTLTILAVALGVAVVLAMELAGNAATGSFHSSMETLAGDNDLEVVASGGVPESVLATLSSQPFFLRISPRIEDFATVTESKQTLPLLVSISSPKAVATSLKPPQMFPRNLPTIPPLNP